MKQNYLGSTFWGLADYSGFVTGIQAAINNLHGQAGIFTGDNLFTYHRNLSFLEDAPLTQAFARNATNEAEKAIIWRTSVLLWAARNGLKLEGDFVEGGCYKGTSARILCEALDFARIDKKYYLYDLFEHDDSMEHHALEDHGKDLYQGVRERFADTPNVIVTQGKIPDVLAAVAPQRISFMHLDMNNAGAEVGALEVLFERMVPGAILVLDDYGWLSYRSQKLAEDPWLLERGYRVLELPTGQGMVIKQ